MSNIRLFALAVLLLIPGLSFANQTASGFCTTGGIKVTTFGSLSSNPVQGSYLGCSVSVSIHGGGLATITDANGGALANPFTASSTNGFWQFAAANGFYDVTLSGGTPALPSPVTIVNLLLNDPNTASITQSSFTGSGFISSTALVAGSGIFRCASVDNCLVFRNIANGLDLALKKTGAAAGNLPADVLDASAFGGIKVSQFFSNSAQSAATGVLACSASDTCVSFRNQANSADIPGLAHDASDRIVIGGAAGFTASIGNITNGLTVGAGLTVGGASSLQGVTATTITASGEIAPSITGGALGDTAHRFDAFIRNLDISGTITGLLSGAGTTNTIPKFTSPTTVGNSSITDNGTTVSTPENVSVGGTSTHTGASTFGATVGIKGPNPWLDITQYGAVGDAQIVVDVVTAVGSTTITSATANFQASDVGKQFSATPTTYSTTGQLIGTITARNSATSITVSITSGTATASSGVRFIWGTDNTTAIQSAITAAQNNCKGGDGSSNSGSVPFEGDCPVVFIPAPSTGIGYVISGAVNTTHEGIAVTTLGREAAAIYLNAPSANFNFTAPSATYHGWYLHGIAFECSYVANTGVTLDSIEESHIENIRVNNCMNQGIKLTNTTGTNGLTTFVDLREAGNVIGILNNSSQQTVFYHCNIYGSSNNSNTLVGVKFTGSHVMNAFHGCWVEGLQTVFQVDNTGGTNITVFSFRDGRILSTVTGFHFISASSSNVNNLMLVNAIVDGNEIQTTASTNWNDFLMNANVVAGSGINIKWTNNMRDSGPTAKGFNTDSSLVHIDYNDNNGVNGANISTGAGVVFGFDCGAEFQLGTTCQIRSANWNVTSAGLGTFAGITTVGAPILPSASGGTTVGNGTFPFSSIFLGTTFTSNFQITAPAVSGARIITQPDLGVTTSTTAVIQLGNGSTALPTGALGANACAATTTVALTGATTSMHLHWNLASDPSAVTGYSTGAIQIYAWLTAGNVNFKQCSNSALTPGAMSVSWEVFN